MTTIFTMASLSLRFRTAIAIFSLLPFQILLAGHAIYNPIVFARDGEPIKAWETRPVSVGIPIPRAADFKEVENLLLVGSDWAQFRPLSYWPNGSIKWLQHIARHEAAWFTSCACIVLYAHT